MRSRMLQVTSKRPVSIHETHVGYGGIATGIVPTGNTGFDAMHVFD